MARIHHNTLFWFNEVSRIVIQISIGVGCFSVYFRGKFTIWCFYINLVSRFLDQKKFTYNFIFCFYHNLKIS